jgi:hypothetical protein
MTIFLALALAITSAGCMNKLLPAKKTAAAPWTLTQADANKLGEPLQRHTDAATVAEYVRRTATVYLWGCVDRLGTPLTAEQEAIRASIGAVLVERIQRNLALGNQLGKGFEYLAAARDELARLTATAGQRCDLATLDAGGQLAEVRELLAAGGAERYVAAQAGDLDRELAAAVASRDLAAVRTWETKSCARRLGNVPCVRKATAAYYEMDAWEPMVEHYLHFEDGDVSGRALLTMLATEHGSDEVLARVDRYLAAHPTMDDHEYDYFAARNLIGHLDAAGKIGCDRLDLLRALLGSKNHQTITIGLAYLGKHACKAAEPAVKPLLASTDSRVRINAAIALGKLGTRTSVPLLREVAASDTHCSTTDECKIKAARAGVGCVCFPVRDAARQSLISIEAR